MVYSSNISKPYVGFNDFRVEKIEWDVFTVDDPSSDRGEEEPDFEEIEPQYKAPAISVDSSGNFAEHEIIGGTTVRQKIGESPLEINITGVCKISTAKKIDKLRIAKYGTIYSDRLPGNSVKVQFASASTSPLEDSGAVPLNDDGDKEFLHEYDLSCVQVTEL